MWRCQSEATMSTSRPLRRSPTPPNSYPRWYFSASGYDRLATCYVLGGACWLRMTSLLLSQNHHCWTDIVPWRCPNHNKHIMRPCHRSHHRHVLFPAFFESQYVVSLRFLNIKYWYGHGSSHVFYEINFVGGGGWGAICSRKMRADNGLRLPTSLGFDN